MKKYFPIHTNTACRNKWTFSTIYLTDGTTASCHRASMATVNEQNFFNFHNLPNKLQDRKKMLQGEWPGNGCEYCRDLEKDGGFSDRKFQLLETNNYPPELDVDINAVTVTPTTLEIFFKNTCNLKCIYCTEKYSSSIQKENQKYGYINFNDERSKLKENKYNTLSPLLWEYLEKNYQSLKRLHVLGGEPLLQVDFIKLLSFFERNPNPNLELELVSNILVKEKTLIIIFDKIKNLIKLKKIKKIEVQASIDAWGPGQEYIRYGLELEKFEKNFNYLLKLPFVKLGLLSTVTSLSIMEMPELAKKFREWKKVRKIFWYVHKVLPHGESNFDPCFFDKEIFVNSFEQTCNLLDGNDFDEKITLDMIQGIFQYLTKTVSDKNKQKELIYTLDQIDIRRTCNWRTTFPWLEKYVV